MEMKVLKIEPRDIYITFEMSIAQAIMLRKSLCMIDPIDLADTTDKEKQAVNYLTKDFYPALDKTIKDVVGEDFDES